jgi:hypothetical protein
MPLADGLMLMAPHPGQGALLQRVIDPSVVDESDPLAADPDLDLFNPGNGFAEPPASSSYPAEFIERYRQAQAARIARIDVLARERVEAARTARGRFTSTADPRDRRAALATGVIVVHRTDADLMSVDLTLDPNDRPYGSLFGRRPDLTNYGILGFGRLSSRRLGPDRALHRRHAGPLRGRHPAPGAATRRRGQRNGRTVAARPPGNVGLADRRRGRGHRAG